MANSFFSRTFLYMGCCPFPQREHEFLVGGSLGRFCLPCCCLRLFERLLLLVECTASRLVLLAPLRVCCCSCIQPPSAGLPFLLFRGLAKRPFAAFAIGYRLVFRLRVGRRSSHLSLSHIHNFQLARTGPLWSVQMSLLGVGFGD